MKIVWAEPAEQDLETIIEHIAKDNFQAALNMDGLLRDCADGLALFPKKGKPGQVPGTRELVAHSNYILAYVVTSDAIQIVAVLHAARQWPPVKQEGTIIIEEGVRQADAGNFTSPDEVKKAFSQWDVDIQ